MIAVLRTIPLDHHRYRDVLRLGAVRVDEDGYPAPLFYGLLRDPLVGGVLQPQFDGFSGDRRGVVRPVGRRTRACFRRGERLPTDTRANLVDRSHGYQILGPVYQSRDGGLCKGGLRCCDRVASLGARSARFLATPNLAKHLVPRYGSSRCGPGKLQVSIARPHGKVCWRSRGRRTRDS